MVEGMKFSWILFFGVWNFRHFFNFKFENKFRLWNHLIFITRNILEYREKEKLRKIELWIEIGKKPFKIIFLSQYNDEVITIQKIV